MREDFQPESTTSSWVVHINDLLTAPYTEWYGVILPKQYFSSDYGTKTCAGYPGTIDHIQQDMDVSWLSCFILFFSNDQFSWKTHTTLFYKNLYSD